MPKKHPLPAEIRALTRDNFSHHVERIIHFIRHAAAQGAPQATKENLQYIVNDLAQAVWDARAEKLPQLVIALSALEGQMIRGLTFPEEASIKRIVERAEPLLNQILLVCAEIQEEWESSEPILPHLNPTDREAALYIDNHPGCGGKEIANGIDKSHEHWRRISWKLEAHGYTNHKDGDGWYPPARR